MLKFWRHLTERTQDTLLAILIALVSFQCSKSTAPEDSTRTFYPTITENKVIEFSNDDNVDRLNEVAIPMIEQAIAKAEGK